MSHDLEVARSVGKIEGLGLHESGDPAAVDDHARDANAARKPKSKAEGVERSALRHVKRDANRTVR
jgi:hypothetical protein